MSEDLLTHPMHSLDNAQCVSASCFEGFHAAAFGETKERLAALCGLPAGQVVPSEKVLPLLEGAEETATAEPFGLSAALATPRNNFAALEQLCRTAATTEDMMRMLARAARLYHDGADYEVVEEDDGLVLRIGFSGELPPLVYDFALGVAVRAIRAWAGLSRREHRVALSTPRPVRAADYERFFAPAEVRFDAGHHALWVARDAASRPVPSAAPAVHAALVELLDRALLVSLGGPVRATERSAAERVRAVLKHDIRLRMDVTFDDVASRLSMAPRTLRRALQSEGLSFGQLYAEERSRAACMLLRSTRLPLAEVAARVGFTDVAPFVRAFKRWMQITPGAYRSAHAASTERSSLRHSQVVPRGDHADDADEIPGTRGVAV
jgi:AraC-like DNA-binding protein